LVIHGWVSAEKLEQIYQSSEYISQIWIYGNSLQSYIIAIIVPDADALNNWATTAGLVANMAGLCTNPQVKKLVLEDITRRGKESKVQPTHTHTHTPRT